MTTIIRRLDEFTVAQIRAGEAIEHPAAVVKELTENAIDAGATIIRVEIRGGGKREIRITDNGSGIPSDQVELAFERHTTSKLRQADDLFNIMTLGFRGEALASMASVAQVTCTTRTAGEDVGVELRLARGKVVSRTSRGCPVGTTMLIQNLFGEVPVRLGFLKSDAAEAARVSEVVQHAALSRPGIRWTLITDGREQLQTSGNGDVRDVLLALYGPEVVHDLIPVDDHDGSGEQEMRVSGWISQPRRALGTRKGMHLFVNGRWIQASSNIGTAVEESYFRHMQKGRHPYACLNIEVHPSVVDVNIHPSKREVKLRFNDRVIALLGRAIRTALSDYPMDVPQDAPSPAPSSAPQQPVHPGRGWNALASPAAAFSAPQKEERTRSTSEATRPYTAPESAQSMQAGKRDLSDAPPSPAMPPDAGRPFRQAEAARVRPAPIADQRRPFLSPPQSTEQPTAPTPPEQAAMPFSPSQSLVAISGAVLPDLYPIGQHEQTWILASGSNALYVIDQHGAHERIVYERLLRETADRPIIQQQLLVSQPVSLPPAMAHLLAAHRADLEQWGFGIEQSEDGSLIVTALPDQLHSEDIQTTLMELGSYLLDGTGSTPAAWRDHILATVACHSSVRAGQALSSTEMHELIQQLRTCNNPDTCAHGRSVIFVMRNSWLEQRFGRKG
jgi:DNA mismatch repair protein MutL